MARIQLPDVQNLPAITSPAEINRLFLNVSPVKLYALMNMPDCPRIMIGRKILLPTKRFLEWLETSGGCPNKSE